jgi:hypothetical protein
VEATDYLTGLKGEGRPQWTRITRVVEGAENALFKDTFHGRWDPLPTAVRAAGGCAGEGVAQAREQVRDSLTRVTLHHSCPHSKRARTCASHSAPQRTLTH